MVSVTIWSSTGRGKEQAGTLSCLGREYTTGNTAKKAGRCDKDSGLFKSFISQDDLKAVMENSPPKGYLQDHTVISATHSRIFTESKGIIPNLQWEDQDQNLTRSKQKPNNATGCKNNHQSMGCKSNGDCCDSDALQWLKIFQPYCSSSPKHLGSHPVFLSTPDRQL